MSSRLWEFFLQDDVENFQRFLANASYAPGGQRAPGGGGGGGGGGGSPLIPKVGSPGTMMESSPSSFSSKNRKASATLLGAPSSDRGGSQRTSTTLSRADLNARDHFGRTILHHVASSQKPSAIDFALALLEIPFLDIYAQDWESGWTALHRALYVGNITIARALVTWDMRNVIAFNKLGHSNHQVGGLFNTKDREGHSPLDVYGGTITSRDIKRIVHTKDGLDPSIADAAGSDATSDSASAHGDDNGDYGCYKAMGALHSQTGLRGDEVFTFGSNKNLNLGLGDQDDRQYPEQVVLRRPEHLLRRFYSEHQESSDSDSPSGNSSSSELPALIRNKPITLQGIAMSKLHTAIITNDPESNLFISGFGPGGRLGTGDESTRFSFVCIETGGLAGKKVLSVALGQDHTLAITDQGEILSWGSNKYGQLGYNLPRSNNKNDVPIQTTPRQIFNPFKKEIILGASASSVHSVVFSNAGLYTFGKNEGQLGIVDSDARSLEIQTTPRRVGASLFSCPIQMASAIDRATAILLQNHEVWVFSQYGYSKVTLPLDASPSFIRNSFMSTRYDPAVNHVVKVTSGGNTICALSSSGEVFTVQVSTPESTSASSSTTNPVKIRNSLSQPVRAWSVRKAHMAAVDVDVGQDGSIIICTSSGTAWRREKRDKRTNSKDGTSKDYKFSRIPGLSRVVGVTSNAFGAYAVMQRNCDITKEQVHIDHSTLWDDFFPLLPFDLLRMAADTLSLEDTEDISLDLRPAMAIKRAIFASPDIESEFHSAIGTHTLSDSSSGTVWITSTVTDARIPVHEFVLAGRSPVLRKALHDFRQAYYYSIPDILAIGYGHDGQCQIKFQGIDFLTILNLIFFVYTDNVLDVWHQAKLSPENAYRYRQVRTEVMRIAAHLALPSLERAARLMIEPAKCLKTDMSRAIRDPRFFESADVVVQLSDDTAKVHSDVVCQRCPFFEALFHGLSGGKWVSARRTNPSEPVHVDLGHINRRVFDFVLQYMYADSEEEQFDEVRSNGLDEFIDLVIDVIFVANELMIDRLAQICQKMLGRFVDSRNVCQFLNSIAPCFVRRFKDAALEYICLNLGDMLENRYLGDLDDDLLRQLDAVCKDNQLTCYPISRERNSESYVYEVYPEVVPLLQRDRQRAIDSMRLRTRLDRVESYNEERPRAPKTEKTPRKEKAPIREMPDAVRSPVLRAKQSTGDMMFPMDEEETSLPPSASTKGKSAVRGTNTFDVNEARPFPGYFSPPLGSSLADKGSLEDPSSLDERLASARSGFLPESPTNTRASALRERMQGSFSPMDKQSGAPWGSPAMSTKKKDLKDIMAEASQSQLSNITLGMSAARLESPGSFAQRPSQKERKKIQQQQMQDKLTAQQKVKDVPQNPWQTPTPVKAKPLAEMAEEEEKDKPIPSPSKIPFQKPMTLRQTLAGGGGQASIKHRAEASSTPSQGLNDNANISMNNNLQTTPSKPGPATPPTHTTTSPLSQQPTPQQPPIQSIRHIPRPEPNFHSPSSSTSMSLATILLQQQTEKEELREAATAKHNLQDIQAEQEFQEWWDKESKRVRELAGLEESASPSASASGKTGPGSSGRGGRRRGKGQSQSQSHGHGHGGHHHPFPPHQHHHNRDHDRDRDRNQNQAPSRKRRQNKESDDVYRPTGDGHHSRATGNINNQPKKKLHGHEKNNSNGTRDSRESTSTPSTRGRGKGKGT